MIIFIIFIDGVINIVIISPLTNNYDFFLYSSPYTISSPHTYSITAFCYSLSLSLSLTVFSCRVTTTLTKTVRTNHTDCTHESYLLIFSQTCRSTYKPYLHICRMVSRHGISFWWYSISSRIITGQISIPVVERTRAIARSHGFRIDVGNKIRDFE